MSRARITARGDQARSPLVRWYRLACPAGCTTAPARGAAEAARLVREHPATCPDPGWTAQPVAEGPVINPLVHAEPLARR
jgi:hypothetical protein